MSWRKCNVNAKHHEIANILQCTFVVGFILICIRMMEVPYIAVTDLLASGLPHKWADRECESMKAVLCMQMEVALMEHTFYTQKVNMCNNANYQKVWWNNIRVIQTKHYWSLLREESSWKSSSNVALWLGRCIQHFSMMSYTSGGHISGFANSLRFLPLIASSISCLSDQPLYGCTFARVKISHVVTPNAHTSDFCENLP